MKRIFLVFAILIFTVSVAAQENGQDLLKNLQDKYSGDSGFSADFVQYVNSSRKMKGKIYYKPENNIRLETNSAIIVSNGETNWNYNKKQNKVIISEYDESDASVLSFNNVLFDYPSKSTIEIIEKNDEEILVITPKNKQELNFSEAELWISKNDLINKLEIKDLNNTEIVIELSNYSFNRDLTDSEFSFAPPEGSKVIDLR